MATNIGPVDVVLNAKNRTQNADCRRFKINQRDKGTSDEQGALVWKTMGKDRRSPLLQL
jgi:hypothetical protein